MAAAVVQLIGQFYSSVNTTTNICTITNTPTVGNHLIYLAARGVASDTLQSVADSAGNTWQIDKTEGDATVPCGLGLASCKVTSALTGGASTITGTWGVANTRKVSYILEVSGLDPASWFGSATAKQQNASANTRTTTNSLAAATSGDLIIGMWTLSSTETGFTSTSPFTAIPAGTAAGYFNGASSTCVEGNYLVTSDTVAKTPAATGARTVAYFGWAATYKQPATYQPRHAAINFQDPGLLMQTLRDRWQRRRSGIYVPDPRIATA